MVKQLEHELKNYNLYKTVANYFSVEGILKLEEYFDKRAAEEHNHAGWIHHFLSEADVKFTYPLIEKNAEAINDYVSPFEVSVDREIQTTNMIYVIYEKALALRDYMTASWLLEKLIKEQIEEENTSRMALTIMNQESDIFLKADAVLDLLGG